MADHKYMETQVYDVSLGTDTYKCYVSLYGTSWDGHTELTDTAYDDIAVSIGGLKQPAADYPDTESWLTDFDVWAFDDGGGEYLYMDVQVPHSYVPGTDWLFHVHFTAPDAIADGDTVKFTVTYTHAAIDGVFPASATGTCTYTNSTGGPVAANTHLIASGCTIDGTGLSLSSIGYYKLERDATGTHTGDAYLLSVDAHIQKNRIGSENEYSG